MKFSEAIEKFATWQSFGRREGTVVSYRVLLTQFAIFMKNCDISVVTLDDIMQYLAVMEDVGFTKQHFIKKCLAMKKFFEFNYKQKVCTLDFQLIPTVQREYNFPKVATVEEYEKVLGVIPVNNDPRHIRNKTLLMMYKDTGSRLSEILSLDVEQIDTLNMTAVIKTKKSKSLTPIRQIFWNHDTNEQLKLWLKKRRHLNGVIKNVDQEALFIATNGASGGKRFGKQGVMCMVKGYSETAGIGRTLNIHSLRHLFGITLAEQNVNDGNIATLMGHSDVNSSRPYTILKGDGMARIYDKYMRKH